MPNHRILVVEDDTALRQNVTKLLQRMGHDVVEAGDGAAAIDLIRKAPDALDLVLSDIRMPRMSGIELLERVSRCRSELPVALMTGYSDLEDSITALKLGAFDFILKPFEAGALQELIKRLPRAHPGRLVAAGSATRFEETLTITMTSRLDSIYDVSAFVRVHCQPICERLDLNLNNVSLCVSEALHNAVIHGNLGVSSALKEEPDGWQLFHDEIRARETHAVAASLDVRLELTAGENALRVAVRDCGKGFDYGSKLAGEVGGWQEHGRGLQLIRALSDELAFDPPGNRIRFAFHARDRDACYTKPA